MQTKTTAKPYKHLSFHEKLTPIIIKKHNKSSNELSKEEKRPYNDYLGFSGFVQQEKGGFWIENSRYMKEVHGFEGKQRKERKRKFKNRFVGRWDKENRLAVKKDYLERVKALGINRAVCLPSVSASLVVKTFKKFGVTNLFGFEIKREVFKAGIKSLRQSNLRKDILMYQGDVLNHLNSFKESCFVEADFCGHITTYKKFFKNLPQYWSLTVSSIYFGDQSEIIKQFEIYMGGKVKMGKMTEIEKNGGVYEYAPMYIGKNLFHLYKYRDGNKENKASTMYVISNI